MNNAVCMMAGIMILLVADAGSAQENAAHGAADSLDLGKIRIESREARDLLKNEFISVRGKGTGFIPRGELPVLVLEQVNDDVCRERISAEMRRHSPDKRVTGTVKEEGEVFAAIAGSASFWVHRGSGSSKSTETKQSMAVRQTKIDHFKKAAQLALHYVAKHQLVRLAEGEEMDVLFVSGVKNALAVVGEQAPIDEFVSDYYVGFGRRFKGTPVVGSKLVIRLNGNGDVVMVERNWRQIKEVSGREAIISKKSLPELMIKEPGFVEKYDAKSVRPEDITIADAQCGYMEAPLDYVQDSLRPGCSVSYFVGKKREEILPQIFVALEEEGTVQKVLGNKYRDRKTD